MIASNSNQEIDFSGMTVNERLFAAELLEEFEKEARKRNRDRMVSILNKVQLQETESIVDSILNNPRKYGF